MGFVVTFVSLIFAIAASAQSVPPADEGKALLERACTPCHGLRTVTSQRNPKERWSAIVDDMISRGAEGTDAEFDKIGEYLATHYGPKVNVNKAAAEELTGKAELPKATAAAIVEYREKNGAFRSLEDLKKVPGADWGAIDSKKDRLEFGEAK